MKNVILNIEFDQDVDEPDKNNSWWELESFHKDSRVNPGEFISVDSASKLISGADSEWQEKLDSELAFIVSCYDHGSAQWGLPGEVFQCQWDTAPIAGIVHFTGDPSHLPEDQRASVRSFLSEYTDWFNGNCYRYAFEGVCGGCGSPDGEVIESCGGFIGLDGIKEAILESLAANEWKVTKIVGDASILFNLSDFTPAGEVEV